MAPKPNISISPYSAFKSNPILLNDVDGDKADVGTNSKGIRKNIKKSANKLVDDLKKKTGLNLELVDGHLLNHAVIIDEGVSLTAKKKLLI